MHVVLQRPVKGMRSMETYWVNGTLTLRGGDSGLGIYAYRIVAERVDPYEIKDNEQ